MRILFIVAVLFTLAGCESMDFTSLTVSTHSHYSPSTRISYTLGYYSGNHYNGYRVYGDYGHRYYHAPYNYAYHRHFYSPPVIVHQHVHTSYCEHNYRPRDHHRQDYVPPQQRDNHANNNYRRENRQDHRRDKGRKRK